MNKILIWKNDLESVEKIYLPTNEIVWRVIKIDLGGHILEVREYEECPREYIRDKKINQILNGN
jgi:hypothetical protein